MKSEAEIKTEWKNWMSIILFLIGLISFSIPLFTYKLIPVFSLDWQMLVFGFIKFTSLTIESLFIYPLGIFPDFFTFTIAMSLLPFAVYNSKLTNHHLYSILGISIFAEIGFFIWDFMKKPYPYNNQFIFVYSTALPLVVFSFFLIHFKLKKNEISLLRTEQSILTISPISELFQTLYKYSEIATNHFLKVLTYGMFYLVISKLLTALCFAIIYIAIPLAVFTIIWVIIIIFIIAFIIIFLRSKGGQAEAEDVDKSELDPCPICEKQDINHKLYLCPDCKTNLCTYTQGGVFGTSRKCGKCGKENVKEIVNLNDKGLIFTGITQEDHSLERCPICLVRSKNHSVYVCEKCHQTQCNSISEGGLFSSCYYCGESSKYLRNTQNYNVTKFMSDEVRKDTNSDLDSCDICFNRELNHVSYFCEDCNHRFCQSTESNHIYDQCPKCSGIKINILRKYNVKYIFQDKPSRDEKNNEQCPYCFSKESEHTVYRCENCNGNFCGSTIHTKFPNRLCPHCEHSIFSKEKILNPRR